MGVSANDANAAATAAAAPTASTAATVQKYHLVEAEEVESSRVKAPGSVTKKKGKTNWSQFPVDSAGAAAGTESVDSTGSDDSNSQRNDMSSATTAAATTPSTSRRGSNGGRGSGSRPFHNNGGRGSGPRRNYDSNGAYINGVYVPNTDPKITAQYAKEQIEFYFSPDNLVRDIFLRQHMDVDGFVPLAFVGSFQAVFAVHQDYASLLEAMHASESVELDVTNEKVRLRDGWQQWLWPNADGGYGVPAYIKAPAPATENDVTSA